MVKWNDWLIPGQGLMRGGLTKRQFRSHVSIFGQGVITGATLVSSPDRHLLSDEIQFFVRNTYMPSDRTTKPLNYQYATFGVYFTKVGNHNALMCATRIEFDLDSAEHAYFEEVNNFSSNQKKSICSAICLSPVESLCFNHQDNILILNFQDKNKKHKITQDVQPLNTNLLIKGAVHPQKGNVLIDVELKEGPIKNAKSN